MGKSFRKEIVRTIRWKVWTCCRNARLSGKVHSFRKGWEPLEAMRYYRRAGRIQGGGMVKKFFKVSIGPLGLFSCVKTLKIRRIIFTRAES